MTRRPPALARWLLERCTRPADRDAVLGDLYEEFDARAAVSPAQASRWFWRQSLRSLIPVLRQRWPAPLQPVSRGGIMGTLWQDARFSWRLTRRQPLVSVVAITSLVVGMALTAIVFAILNAAVIRPLPVQAPDDLVVILERRGTGVNHNLSYPDYQDYRAAQRRFTDIFAVSPTQLSLRLGGRTEIVTAELVTGGYFSTLGIRPSWGRALADSDDGWGRAPVAVVSERLWRSWGQTLPLAGDASMLLNSAPFTVVGVVDDRFAGVVIGRRVDVWIPASHQPVIQATPDDRRILTARTMSWLTVMARRQPGVADSVLTDDLMRIERGAAAAAGMEPRTLFVSRGARGDFVMPESVQAMLRLLLVAAFVVLLVACANVANLLMARAADRSREFALRMALGAGRWRLVRQLLFEALLFGGVSALIALLVASGGARAAATLLVQFGQPVVLDLSLDWRVTSFILGLGVLSTLVSSVVPAVHVLRATRLTALAEGHRNVTGGRVAGLVRSGLVAGQFALSLALVVTAVLLVRTVVNLRQTPMGFATGEVVLVSASPGAAQYSPARATAYVTSALARLSAEPGVRTAAFARVLPVAGGGSRLTIAVSGYTPQPDEDMEINYNVVGGDYFGAMGIPLLDGGAAPMGPRAGGPIPVVVNSTMASRYWPGARAVGQQFRLGHLADAPVAMVVGVAADAKYREVREAARPSFYLPMEPRAAMNGTFHVRVHGSPAAMIPALRRALTEVDSAVPITSAQTLDTQLDRNITDDRLAMTVGLSLAASALLLAGVGLFGAMAHMVGQRTGEIGVRVALGATSTTIRRLVLRQALVIALVGTALGLGLALWAATLTASRLYAVGRFDPASFLVAAGILVAVAVASAPAPAHRASRVDPVDALRR
jgi:predicted permease